MPQRRPLRKSRQSTAARLRRAPARAGSVQGFSLVECLMAVALLGLSAATVGGFLARQIRNAAANQLTTVAYSFAAAEIEEIRALPFAAMANRSHQENLGEVTFDVVSSVADDTPASHMKTVTVAVNWNDPDGSQEITLRTVFTEVSSI